jgi:hypothetical protein
MTSENDFRKPTANLPDTRQENQKPLDTHQDNRFRVACKDAGDVNCEFEYEDVNLDAVKDAFQGHYIDAHPGHKVNDAYMLAMANHYS